ncbi:MAG: hypothetical protein K6G81_03550 [Lachnospiraceae bacterium]|nr:hypothetical protein [Lachnospiraceae bacterium]
MDKKYQLTFYKAEYAQYNRILEDDDIRKQVSTFLIKYISLEAFYKKMLITMKEKNGKVLSKKEKQHLFVSVADVNNVLEYFGISCDKQLIERIFGSNDKNYMECSVKKLRDRLVHNVNDNVLRVIIERYDKINEDLDLFAGILN